MMERWTETRFMPGVLFAEDFEDEPPPSPVQSAASEADAHGIDAHGIDAHGIDDSGAPATAWEDRPRYSVVELRDATAIARDEGIRSGRATALEGIDGKRLAAIEHAVALLEDARAAALASVEDECERIASTALTLLLGFLPCLAERFATDQLRSTLLGFTGTLVEAGAVTIEVHPDLLPEVERALAPSAARGHAVAIVPDPTLGRADAAASWNNGRGVRDIASLRRAMRDALAAAGLLETTIVDTEGDARHGH